MAEFPSRKSEALALLYLQSQDLSDKKPEEILEMFNFAEKAISEHQSSINKNKEHKSLISQL